MFCSWASGSPLPYEALCSRINILGLFALLCSLVAVAWRCSFFLCFSSKWTDSYLISGYRYLTRKVCTVWTFHIYQHCAGWPVQQQSRSTHLPIYGKGIDWALMPQGILEKFTLPYSPLKRCHKTFKFNWFQTISKVFFYCSKNRIGLI